MAPTDTSSEAMAALVALHRSQDPADRVRTAFEMSEQATAITAAGVRSRHPDYDDVTTAWAVRRLRVGDQLFVAVWPDAPLVEP